MEVALCTVPVTWGMVESSMDLGLPQPWHLSLLWGDTQSRASTPSLHPPATVVPTASCKEEDEEVEEGR